MRSLQTDGRDIGQLLTYALRPKMRPGADGVYAQLIGRYRDELTFRTSFDAVIGGMDLRVLHAGDLGLVVTPRRESVFAYRLSSESATWTKDRAKVLRGLAHLGIAAYAYPHPDDLQDPTVRYIDVVPCEDFIRRSCTQLRERAEAVAIGRLDDRDAATSGDAIVELALRAGVDAAWSEWDQMPAADVASRGRSSGRISTKCAAYWVLRAVRDLVDHGLARPVGKETDGRFQLLDRYRHQVGASASLEGYRALSALNQVGAATPDPRDPLSRYPLPGRPPQFTGTETGPDGGPDTGPEASPQSAGDTGGGNLDVGDDSSRTQETS